MRVLHVLSNFGIGGAEVWIIALLKYFEQLRKAGGASIEMDVFLTHGYRDKLDSDAEAHGARLIYGKYSRGTLPSFIRKWRTTLASGKYCAIHDHQEFSAGWHFLFGLGLLPQVRIAHLHNPMSHQIRYGNSLARRATISLGNHLITRHATHLLSTSNDLITEQGFTELGSAKRLTKKAVYCGFDPKRFCGDQAAAMRSVRTEFDLPSDARVLLFVGRLDSNMDESKNQKNPTWCIEVAKECAKKDPAFFCLLAGGGDAMRSRLEERVKGWGLGDRVRFIGARSDVPRLMLGADALLLPSMSEGLGMVAVEAQAAGLPVVASNGVPRECMVVPGLVRFLALEDAVDAWADAVLNAMAGPKWDLVSANDAVSRSPFSISESAKALIDIYCGA